MKKLIILFMIASLLVGCVDQNQEKIINDEKSIVVTSTTIMTICEKLDIHLSGVPQSSLVEIPEKYKDATIVGTPMAPDMEVLSDMNPDWVLSPLTLMSDLKPKFEAANLNYAFVNLKSVNAMYQAIHDLGDLFDRKQEARNLVDEYSDFIKAYNQEIYSNKKPTVLLLMGLPGSYIVATENSYAGSLVELAGGQNVYAGSEEEFLNVNPEDMLQKNPDIILRTAHALPDEVMKMFQDEFINNDIWKHFDAVKNNQVYDLPSGLFGMSANFEYADGLNYLKDILYP